ncbi:MAG TPA: PHP domain-containing protein [Ignavibacteriales bacterium]|nr:PHP domain-containing protein [Ignavibacteriales bacterium]HOL81127.1 PHP domain-containing protein [Ignavibacteriales bacterium]HOM65230.1 PHP domain-containing protein [Ignavibacteriales bacterium]HPP33517.1 PHP domain-containing protein [Ignavibacteriales bacterium]
MKKIDLHIHTTFSDGFYSPFQIIDLAKQNDLSIISITDHDTVDAYLKTDVIDYAKKLNIEIIPGLEISTDYEGEEMHILGYFIDLHNEELINFLEYISKERVERIKKITKKLQKNGINVTFEDVLENNVSKTLGRPHIANIMLKKGYVKDITEAFNKHLGMHCYAYEPRVHVSPKVAIDYIHNSGGIAILAHPNRMKEDYIKYLIDSQIDGFEFIHPSHNSHITHHYYYLAENYYLIATGGSDFHGGNKKDEINFGNFYITEKNYENIINYYQKI